VNFPLIAAGLAVLAGALTEWVVLVLVLGLLSSVGAVAKNYQGIDIPVSSGITFPMTLLIVYLGMSLFVPPPATMHLLLLGLVFISFLGFIDDMLGQRDTLGFKGHFGALFQGRLTTGGLKALGGGLIALFVAYFSSSGGGNIVLNTIILALSTNMLNLLDLRPGRAIKGFLFFLLLLLLVSWESIDWFLLAPIVGMIVVYFSYDLKARTMMGDAGSNVLGFYLGYLVITHLSLYSRCGVLIFLIGLHLYTERYSLSQTIEANRFLYALDQLGRGEKHDQRAKTD